MEDWGQGPAARGQQCLGHITQY